MQGTWHVRSLVRLVLGAVLLCVAWILLTSTQAGAAEQEDSRQASPAMPLLAKLSPAKPSHAAGVQPLKATATRPVVPVMPAVPLAPVVARVEQVVVAAVPVAEKPVAHVKHVAVAALPVVEKPLTRVTRVVVAVVDEVPVIGGGGEVTLPLPGADGTDPLPQLEGVVPIAEPADQPSVTSTKSIVAQRVSTATPDSASLLAATLRPHAEPRAQGAALRFQAVPTQEPSPTVPWPGQAPAPMPPTTPSAGAGLGQADVATTPPLVFLPPPGVSGRDRADWRVPGSLPAHPGTRPD